MLSKMKQLSSVRLLVFLKNIIFSSSAVAQLREVGIPECTSMRDKNMTSGVIFQSVKKTNIACASLRATSDMCQSYCYRHATAECQLHSILFTSPDKAKDQKGFNYYFIVKSENTERDDWCPLKKGFQLLSEDGPCVKFHTDRQCWHDANKACESYSPHSRLVVLGNREKNDLVRAAGKAINAKFNAPLWIGLSVFSNNTYRWVDGKVMTFTAWARGRTGRRDMKCVAFYRAGDWNWSRKACKMKFPYICETIP